ncbi:MAG: glycoside hydrolase family 2 TIM barrel-domain containing protein, partial [Bacteroidota bacterium]
FGGIFRPVYLEVMPKNHIERIAVDAKANGSLAADIFTTSAAGTVQLALLDMDGKKLQDLNLTKKSYEKGKFHIKTKAVNIKTWNPEYPHLYQLEVALLDKNGILTHKIKERIGFRTVELLESDGIYVNGQKIKFKGVNRHSFYPSSGRTTSKALSIAHIKMMKDMNMNAVRMSHYPPDKHFLEACDSLGLFVIDEVCTWHSPHLDTEVGRKIVEETVARDVNHPSILLWSNGNETGWNTELDDDYAIWDIQQREVIHPWNIFRKTNTLHYFHYHGLANDAPKKDKIFFPTEFLHGLYDGGHGAGLEDYWEKMWDMPLSAGGFLWDFADEAIERTDRNNQLDTDGNHAADGIVGPYGEKEASYFAIKEIWSPVYIYDRFIRPNFNGVFKVENRFHFTSLSECSLIASWMKFDAPSITKQGTFLFKEAVKLPSLAPEEVGTFTVNKPSNWQQADVLYLTAFDPYGKEIFTWSYPVQKPKTLNEKLIKHFSNGAVTSEETNGEIIVSANGLTYAFSKDSGVLNKVEKNGQLIPLSNGPIILDQNAIIEQLNLIPSENKLEVEFIYELME